MNGHGSSGGGVSPTELAKKLAEAQRLVVRFSRENERLSSTNEQLRVRRLVVDNDYKGGSPSVSTPLCRSVVLQGAIAGTQDDSQ